MKNMKTKEQWLASFNHSSYKENNYTHHPFGQMLWKTNRKEVICFYPLYSIGCDDEYYLTSFIVNTFKIKYPYLEDVWHRECANHNHAENCTRHRCCDIDKAYNIYCKYVNRTKSKAK